jgi:hypothetical protein
VHRRRQAVERARALGLLAPSPGAVEAHRLTGKSQEICDARPPGLVPGSGLYP